ncbi:MULTISPECIES: helix-turn-helix domain-containing protein [unclassified Acinetobacter]|uniref:helix-turn-helix domain-containing protein n=1 Tax=unclassified Acinetobacter TaxID=196816 RepID=UPI0035B74ECB
MAKVTEFGKMLRILRIEKNVMLKEMADAIGVSSPYLSAIETGNKPINANLLNKIISFLSLSDEKANSLITQASKLEQDVIIRPSNDYEAELAMMFARRLDNNTFDLEKLKKFLAEVDSDVK